MTSVIWRWVITEMWVLDAISFTVAGTLCLVANTTNFAIKARPAVSKLVATVPLICVCVFFASEITPGRNSRLTDDQVQVFRDGHWHEANSPDEQGEAASYFRRELSRLLTIMSVLVTLAAGGAAGFGRDGKTAREKGGAH